MKIFALIAGFGLICAITVLAGFLGYEFLKLFLTVIEGARTLEPSVYVPLAATITTAVLGLTATLYSQNKARKRAVESAFRERKIAIYLEFLQTFERLMLAAKSELNLEPVDQNELTIKLVKVRTQAVLWGSTGVLKALSEFTKVGEGNPLKMLRVMDNIQREMRKDLGLSNFGLETNFFTTLILSNPEDLHKLDVKSDN